MLGGGRLLCGSGRRNNGWGLEHEGPHLASGHLVSSFASFLGRSRMNCGGGSKRGFWTSLTSLCRRTGCEETLPN